MIIREYGRIVSEFHSEKFSVSPDLCIIPDKSFQNLKKFINENIEYSNEINDAFFSYTHRGVEIIKVKNYVGIIETADGAQIEILPKIYLGSGDHSSAETITETKNIFLRMLKHLRNSPFAQINTAHLNTRKFPLLEVFISAFLTELESLIKKGLKQSYILEEENLNHFKGKLKIEKNILYNFANKTKFFVEYDEFCYDIAQNRLIKSTLIYLKDKSRLYANLITINRLICLFENIPYSSDFEKDFSLISGQNRLYSHYTQVLNWASVFLRGHSFTSFEGTHLNKAILFPMEKIFEDYIAYLFIKYCKDESIDIQKFRYFLIDKHNSKGKFRLRPDIVCYNGPVVKVYDTKWKIIDQNKSSENYLISQSDMYQLYAYGKKYKVDENGFLCLLYPKTDKFFKPLEDFNYENNPNLLLKAIPIDLSLEEHMILENNKLLH